MKLHAHGSGHGHGRGHGVDPMGAYTAKQYGPWHDDIMMMMTIWPGHVAGHMARPYGPWHDSDDDDDDGEMMMMTTMRR